MTSEQVHMGVNKYETVIATEHSCEWMKDWLSGKHSYCTPKLTGELYISGCDANYEVPIEYCPGCGRKIEVISD